MMMIFLEQDRFLEEQYEFESQTSEHQDMYYSHGYNSAFICLPAYQQKAIAIEQYRKEQAMLNASEG